MEIYDISMNINSEMAVYGNHFENRPRIETLNDHSRGVTHESKITMNMHNGTHLDAPLHMIKNGKTMDSLALNQVITPCKVIDFTGVAERITCADFNDKKVKQGDFLLFKTRNSFQDQFIPDFVYLDRSGAAFLKDQRISGAGIDSLGIERSQPEHETHKILLEAGIVILEGLRLKDVEPGEYFLFAAPLKIDNVEAAPARAVLVKGMRAD
ncbi:MAG TPA: cyclase family protein [Bacillota bacterium]|nr:cyclase family protein [Bacillota bacterium]